MFIWVDVVLTTSRRTIKAADFIACRVCMFAHSHTDENRLTSMRLILGTLAHFQDSRMLFFALTHVAIDTGLTILLDGNSPQRGAGSFKCHKSQHEPIASENVAIDTKMLWVCLWGNPV